MMARGLRREEKAGLLVALALHVALVIALLLQPDKPEATPPVERMTVNLATEVGLDATAPDPVPQSRAAVAPTLSDTPAAEVVQAPLAPPVERAVEPRVTRVQSPIPRPTAQPRRQPEARPTAQPRRQSDARPRRRPDAQERVKPTEKTGGSRIGDNFLEGAGNSARTSETRVPASQIGASAKASIVAAIARQVRPHWQGAAPSGADAELLATVLAFELNPDGSLKGRPRVIAQEGVTPANEAQKERHAEVAIRAVQLAAPFDLPAEYYSAWKSIRGARFDRNLSR